MADPPPRKNAFEEMFDQPITRPETDEGMGPTSGGDHSVERERAENARNGARDIKTEGED